MQNGRTRATGATYLMLLIGVAIISVGLAASAQLWSALDRHYKRTQLEWVGNQYRVAIGSYYEASPGTVKNFPPELKELVFDNRYLSIRRHIRTLYPDPFDRNALWEAVPAPNGGIMGVRPTSKGSSDKIFVYTPATQRISARLN